MCCYLFTYLFIYFAVFNNMRLSYDIVNQMKLFSFRFGLFSFLHAIVLNNYNCWVDTHIVRVRMCLCVNAQRKTKKKRRSLWISKFNFHMCAPFDTHSVPIWYLSTCPANTLPRSRTQIADDFLVFVCYLISFHLIWFYEEKKNKDSEGDNGGDGDSGKCLMLSLLRWSCDGGTSCYKWKRKEKNEK